MRATVFLLMMCSILCLQTVMSSYVVVNHAPVSTTMLADAPTFSTYIGGSDDDSVHCVVVDDEGYVYIAGTTLSSDLPSSGGPAIPYSGNYDYFVMKLTNESEVVYTTYIGGISAEGSVDIHPGGGCSIDVDDTGRVYMTGYTYSPNFPLENAWDSSHNGHADCFALRLSPSGADIEYATFIGGSQNDLGTSIAIDDLGNAYITGWTGSSDFPTQAAFDDSYGGSTDNFLVKLDASGQLNYSTFVGGGSSEHTLSNGIAVDENGTAYITGSTSSSNFPTVNAYDDTKDGLSSDIFFCKVDSTGQLLFSSFFGSSSSDESGAIALDQGGNIYLTGHGGGDVPATDVLSSSPEIFVAKFDNSGQDLVYCAVFGGPSADNPYGLEVDEDGCAFVTGFTYSASFPMVNAFSDGLNGWRDCFLLKLSSGGDQILFSTFIGGSDEEMGLSIVKSNYGSIFLVGLTNSTDFPTASPLVPTNQKLDGFLVRLDDTWPDIPLEPTTTIPTTPTSSPSTTTDPGSGPAQNNLTLILGFGIGFEIVIVLWLVRKRLRD